MRSIRALVAIGMATAVLTACSSSSSSSSSTAAGASTSSTPSSTAAAADAATYMNSLCTTVSTWQQAIKDENTSLQSAVQSAASPQDAKDALETFLTAVVGDTQTMVDEVQALGAPAVDGGDTASAAVVTALTNIQTLFQDALDQVKSLDTSNPAAMAGALTSLATDLQQGGQDAAAALSNIDSQSLKDAAATAPACQSL